MIHDPTDLVGEAEALETRQRQAEHRARLEAQDWKWVMSQKRGRRLVWRLLSRTGLYRSSFTGTSQTFFLEGERNIGLGVLAILMEHCPDDYAKMMVEQREYE